MLYFQKKEWLFIALGLSLFRIQEWRSANSSTTEENYYARADRRTSMFRRTVASAYQCICNSFGWVKMLRNAYRIQSPEDSTTDELSSRKVLDPQGPFLRRWNKIFVLACVLAISVDPLFFYIPIVDRHNMCLDLDNNMKVAASVLRSFTDIFYLLHIVFQFRTGFIAPSSRVFGRGILIEDSLAIAKRYISSYFLVDILSVLPLPQVQRKSLSFLYLITFRLYLFNQIGISSGGGSIYST